MIKLLTDKENYALWGLLSQAKETVMKARQKELDQYRISQAKAAVLHIIYASGGSVTPGEIARWLLRTPHSISEIITRMEKEGLVKKVRDKNKQNIVHVSLKAKGRGIAAKSIKSDTIDKIFDSLSINEKRELRIILMKVLKGSLKETGIESIMPWFP